MSDTTQAENILNADDVQVRIKEFESEYAALPKKYRLKVNIIMKFPQYNILPDHVKLAILVLQKEGMEFGFNYTDLIVKGDQNANLR